MAEKIVVALREFVGAVSALPKMKRGPRGSFGNSIPTDTLLYSADGRLVVFTPAKKTILGMAGSWSRCVSTDARRLSLVASKLKEADFLMLTFAKGFIVLNDPAFSVPGKVADRPDGAGTNEAPSNNWPVNQAALKWLRMTDDPPDANRSYLAQLAHWGLEKNLVDVPRPLAPSQPERHELELAIGMSLGWGAEEAEAASRWFLSNPNLEEDEQTDSLEILLREATSPQEAAAFVVEAAYDRMVAASAAFD